MIKHKLNAPEKDTYFDPADLDEYDIKALEGLKLDEIWYWYEQGNYEGRGHMIMRIGDKYDHHDMGHCSCYGPCDQMSPFDGVELSELKLRFTEGTMKELTTLFDAIEE